MILWIVFPIFAALAIVLSLFFAAGRGICALIGAALKRWL